MKNDFLICKRTFYKNDFYRNKDSFKDKILKKFEKPQWIENKKYKIHRLDEYTSEFGNFMRCYLLETEIFFEGRERDQVFIYQDSVQKIFYSEEELRKLKLQQIEKKINNYWTTDYTTDPQTGELVYLPAYNSKQDKQLIRKLKIHQIEKKCKKNK